MASQILTRKAVAFDAFQSGKTNEEVLSLLKKRFADDDWEKHAYYVGLYRTAYNKAKKEKKLPKFRALHTQANSAFVLRKAAGKGVPKSKKKEKEKVTAKKEVVKKATAKREVVKKAAAKKEED